MLIGMLIVHFGGPAPAAAQSTDTYVVKSGDTLYSIAQRVGASVRALQAWNDLDDDTLSVGDTLRVRPLQRPDNDAAEDSTNADAAPDARNTAPVADSLPPVEPDTAQGSASEDTTDSTETTSSDAEQEASDEEEPETAAGDSARVERPEGATWIDLALHTGLSADSLWRWNEGPETLPDVVQLPASAVKTGRHTVTEGETFYSIAGTYGVSVRSLQAANDMDADDLRIGQELRIPGQQPELSEAWAAPDTIQVSMFPSSFAGRLTASGARYDPDVLVGSHPTLPFDSVVLLSKPIDASPQDGRHVFVRIVDRSVNGPEISEAAAEALALDESGEVGLRVVWRARDS